MNIIRCSDADEIAHKVSEMIINKIKEKPDAILGLATGASPVKTYEKLIEAYKKGEISFKDVKTFNLDEYYHLPKSNKNSYYTFMHENLFNSIDIKEENTHVPDGNPADADSYCKEYDKSIDDAGGIDIQLLGIGRNGHIGFNEPSDHFTSGTYKVSLTPSTIEANRIYFDSEEEMPREAITMGVESILKAKTVILIATGKFKAEAVRDMVKGKVSPSCPASVLQKHPDAYIFVDEEAASLL